MTLKNIIISFVVGFIFAIGLGVSGMTQPHKIISFLDIFGNWDISLMFVMVGAILVHSVAYPLVRKRPSPLFASSFQVPARKELTKSLILGSFLFGIGWGIGGYCPGPAVTSLVSLREPVFAFVISMIIGMLIYRKVENKLPLSK